MRFFKWLTGFAVIALLTLVIVNAIDSDLSPTATEWLRPMVSEPSVTENGFYLLLGIDAPAQANAFEVGRARLLVARDCEHSAREKDDWEAELNCFTPALDPHLNQFKDLRNQCENSSSLLLCVAQTADISAWQRTIDIPAHVATRIDRLLELDHFREPLDGMQHSQIAIDQFNVTRLQVARAAVSFVENDPDAALDRLSALEKWTRGLLQQSENYLERIVATASFAIAISALDALELLAQQRGQQVNINYALLSEEDLDWSRTMRGEARWVARLIHEQALTDFVGTNQGGWEQFLSWLGQKFFLPNAFLNEMVVQVHTRMTYFNAPRTDYLTRRREVLSRDLKSFSFGDLRNVLGYFTSRMIPESTYATYSDELRLIDLRLWLLSLRQDLWEVKIAPEDVASTLSDLGSAARDPYFGKVVRWESGVAQLVIDVPPDIEANGRLAVDYALATDGRL